MAKDRFELNPTKPNSVRAFTLEGTVELETADSKSARALLDVLNSFVSDIAIYRQSRSMHKAPEPVPDRKAFALSVWWALLALLLVGMGVLAFWLYI
jgi:hypothetical protein